MLVHFALLGHDGEERLRVRLLVAGEQGSVSFQPPAAATSVMGRCFRAVAHARRYGCHRPPTSFFIPAAFSARVSHLSNRWRSIERPASCSLEKIQPLIVPSRRWQVAQLMSEGQRHRDHRFAPLLVRLGAPMDRARWPVDVFPLQLANGAEPTTGRFGKHQRQFHLRPPCARFVGVLLLAEPLHRGARAGESFEARDGASRVLLLQQISDADGPRSRLAVLIQGWGFLLPMASAILTVLYPHEFTVYDVRVCDVLGDFHDAQNKTKFGPLWDRYVGFIAAVRGAVPAK